MAADVNIEHTGRVQRIEKNRVFVMITAAAACSTCRARKACGVTESADKIIEVMTVDAENFAPGDEVVVGVKRRVGMKAVMYAYTLPLAVLIVLLVAAKAAGASDPVAGVAAVGGVALYYLSLWLLKERIAATVTFTVRKVNE